MAACRVCGVVFEPLPHQVRNSDLACLVCRRAYQKRWRENRAALGLSVRGKASSEWMRNYRSKYQARADVRARRAAAMRRYARDPQLRPRHEARWKVRRALASGRLTRKPCEQCAAPVSQAHHADYSRPLDVNWLCRPCHQAEHARAESK